MTSRLLRRSLGSPTYDGMREVLRTEGYVPVCQGPGLRVRAAGLPLFARADGGGLTQVVRIAVDEGAPGLALSLRDGDTELARATYAGAAVDLHVPEVSAPRQLTLVAQVGGTAVATGRFTLAPQRKWTVHLVHHSHLDIGYTDPQGDVLRNHLRYLDSTLDLAEATADFPAESRFRWTVESALPVRRFLASRPRRVVDRFVELAKAGAVEVTAMPFQMHTEAASTEELHRQLRLTRDLHRRYGIPVRSAMHTDVPGAVAGFVDALAAAGVRHLAAAHNWAGRAVPYRIGGQRLGRPFWWRSAAGNRVLVWFTDTAHGMGYMEGNILGLAHSRELTEELLPGYLFSLAHKPFPYGSESFGWSGMAAADVTKQPYPYDLLHVRVQGADADNAGPSIGPATVARDWNARWAYPRLVTSTNADFLGEAERRVGAQLDTHTGEWTDWWADGLGSGARPLGYARRAQNELRQAETLHALAGTDDAAEAIGDTYDRLGLFDEHTWGAANPWHDTEHGFDAGGLMWERKAGFAYGAADEAADLRARGAAMLGDTLGAPAGTLASYLVVNTGPAERTDAVAAWLPASRVPLTTAVSVRDAAGTVVPHAEDVTDPAEWPTRPGGRLLRFTAVDVPATGHVRYDVVAGAGPAPVTELSEPVVENEHYRVTYDLASATIGAIVDRRTGRDLVNPNGYAGMNQYVYDRYSTAAHVNHLSGHTEAGPDNALLASRTLGRRATLVRAYADGAGVTLEVELSGDGADWVRTTVRLPAGVARVEITNRLAKRPHPEKEGVYFAFPFAVGTPPVAWELTGAVGGTAAPRVPGAPTHLAPLRHWVSYVDGDSTLAWATLEAPLTQFGDIHLPYVPYPPTVRPEPGEPGSLYSWALNNIWDTNFPAQQQGEHTFRYAIATAAGAEPRAFGARTAAGLTDPLVAVALTGTGTPPERGAAVTVDADDVYVSSLGAAPPGHQGRAVYLRSVAAVDREVTVRFAAPVGRATRTTSLGLEPHELTVADGAVRVGVPAEGLVALVVAP
ncbi:hypothetical protein [Actinocatenispora rupis]|uniref:Alpha-mannosidase n=1 Tax=Actinocatenispora rupis TaxID=519421 RepID=A0A8J3N7W6_9ACTN|nr:hypothetical protein [Actinocatenispora rupis]GID09501.1 alpha-mannosidase [Actinocatenispora rupis]